MRALLALFLIPACSAPRIALEPAETVVRDAAEPVVDAKKCDPVKSPDGGLCDPSRDEDHDCIPDSCDDCPNVPQAPVFVSNGTATAGAACKSLAPFDGINRRLIFDGFAERLKFWRDDPNSLGDSQLRFYDGHARFGRAGDGARLITLDAGALGRDMVATAVLLFPEELGVATIAMRVPITPPRPLYGCTIDGPMGAFALVAHTCDAGGSCTSTLLRDGGQPLRKAIPAKVRLDQKFLVRASVKTLTSSVMIGCQIFPAPTNEDEVAGGLQSTLSAANTLTFETTEFRFTSGELGIIAEGAPLEVHSVDVLVP